MKRVTLKLLIIALASALCQAIAFADQIAGTATGSFGQNNTAYSHQATWSFNQGTLVYTGADFTGDTAQLSALSPLGTFHLNAPFFSWGPQTTFNLHLQFSAPPKALGDFSADVDASIFVLESGLVQIRFQDTPVSIGGIFDLTIEDITIGSLLGYSCDQTLQAHISNVSSSVPEPAAILLFGTMIGAAVWLRKRA